MDKKHHAHNAAMTAMLRLLFALSFELKAGLLKEDDLKNRPSSFGIALAKRLSGEKGVSSAFAIAQQRYPGVDLEATTLSDESLTNLLFKGIVDSEGIQKELDASSFFVTVADEPAWRTVWLAYERTENEFNTALVKMEHEFASREYVQIGEIEHVFGLRLWLSKIGVLPISVSDVIEDSKRYIDELYETGRLEPLPTREDSFLSQFSGYYGLGIRERKTKEFQEIYKHLHAKRHAAETDRYPAIADGLLKNMVADPELFFRRINLTDGGESEYFNVPVLSSLGTDQFVNVFLEQHPKSQRTILTALKARYDQGRIDGSLAPEQPWATAVRDKIMVVSDGMSAITKERIRHLLQLTLDPVLQAQI